MEKFKFINKDKTPHQKLRFGTGLVQHRASLWCWVSRLPKGPGVYTFKKGGKFLYIGKALNIKERVKNHFQHLNFKGNLFVNQASKIGYIKTGSEIEALLLEADLIKKYQPKYNVIWRDGKSFFFIGVTKEELPQVFITHQPKPQATRLSVPRARPTSPGQNPPGGRAQASYKLQVEYIGPFIDGKALKKVLRFLRKAFPYYTVKKHPKVPCPYCRLNLCPGPNPNPKEYRKNIKNLIAVLKGKKQSALKNLKRKMKEASGQRKFERAAEIRDQIRSLENIITNARIIEPSIKLQENWDNTQKILQKITKKKGLISRIEAYDISNIQGQKATGSMVVFIDGRPEKDLYRKFKIKIAKKPDDLAMIKEVLSRRLQHQEWPLPDLILIDGGKAQLKAVQLAISNQQLSIPVIALAKRKNELYLENQKRPILLKKFPREIFNLILQLRDEAHRFAIAYHRKLRRMMLW